MMETNQFGNVDAATWRAATTIETMVNDLNRTIQILQCDIAFEEERAGVYDLADPAYPMLARHLAGRLQSIKATIASLEPRLAVLRRQGRAIVA
jgi:hypothetical protein